jgi:hypothetical protein
MCISADLLVSRHQTDDRWRVAKLALCLENPLRAWLEFHHVLAGAIAIAGIAEMARTTIS